MPSKMFDKDFLREILWEDRPGKVIEEIVDTSRWSVHYEMIFKDEDGHHYRTYFSRGATEQQDESPYEYDPQEIECEQVEQVEKTVFVWEASK